MNTLLIIALISNFMYWSNWAKFFISDAVEFPKLQLGYGIIAVISSWEMFPELTLTMILCIVFSSICKIIEWWNGYKKVMDSFTEEEHF